MADCRVKNSVHSAVYNTIRSLIKEDPNITSLADVKSWFGDNYPQVTEEMIVDALVLPEKSNVSASSKILTGRVDSIRKQARLANKLESLLDGTLKRKTPKPKVPPAKEVAELQDTLEELTTLAQGDTELTDVQYADIVGRIENVRMLYNQHYDTSESVSREAIDRALNNIRKIQKELRTKSVESRVADLQKQIDALKDPDAIDINALVTDNTNPTYEPIDERIHRKQIELQDLKNKVQADIDSLRRKKLAEEGINLFGYRFKGSAAQSLVNFYLSLKDLGWELPRTMAFMFDASAFGVQLAPVVVQELASPISNFYKRNIMGRSDVEVFQGWKRLASVFRDGFWNVVKSDFDAIEGFGSLKKSKGTWTRKKYQEILNHPLYHMMDRSGLKISQAKSLTDSEEFFKTSLVNKVNGLGWIKDVSEDTMVTTLNLYRVQMFEQFYKMNPNLTMREYEKVSEHINNLTGTTKEFGKISSAAAVFMSAPRLMVARVKLALKLMGGVNVSKLDIPKTIKEGGLKEGIKFRDPGEAFIFNNLAGIGASYGAFFGLVALMSNVFDSVDFGEDWEESDFLRVRIGPTSFDVTGGMGSVYRTIAQAIYLTNGPSENASPMARDRINYLRNVKKKDAIDSFLQFGRYKLHPTISRGKSVVTGTDFLGRPYSLFGETGGIAPNISAGLRAILPIFMETTYEQYWATPKTGFGTDTAVNLAQFFGVNTFEYSDLSQDVRVKNYFNEIEFKPSIQYPDALSSRKDSRTKEYFKIKYRERFGDALGELILANGGDASRFTKKDLQLKWRSQRKIIEKEFMDKYKDDIKALEAKPKTKKESSSRKRRTRRTRERRSSR